MIHLVPSRIFDSRGIEAHVVEIQQNLVICKAWKGRGCSRFDRNISFKDFSGHSGSSNAREYPF
jgi:hypothetical protein